MKKLVKISLVAGFAITALTGCGSKVSTFETFPEQIVIQSNISNNTGIVTKASFEPDTNGMHYGFDFYDIYFTDSQGINNLLAVRISKKDKLISFLHDIHTQNWEQISSQNTKRINELVLLLQNLEVTNKGYQTVTRQLINNLSNSVFSPEQTITASSDNKEDIVAIIEHNTTVLNKQKTLQRLMDNSITLDNVDQYDYKNIYTIEFSKGKITYNNYAFPGHLRMYLQSSGISEIQLVGNYYNNKPVTLTAKETATLLKVLKTTVNIVISSIKF